MIAILDYGSGNIRSAFRAFSHDGAEVVVTSDPQIIEKSSGLVVPGVGAFASCTQQLRSIGGDEIIAKAISQGKKVFGICVGMQILFTQGVEKGGSAGLGIFPGVVEKLKAPTLPQIGWNQVEPSANSRIFNGVEDSYFYFVHSYGVLAFPGQENTAVTWSEYGGKFVAAIESEQVTATQFHPEKSGRAGLKLISNWINTL